MKPLYLAGQDPDTRRWHTIHLTRESGHYLFGYTQGAMKFPDFGYLERMKDTSRIYYSTKLFPTFANRLLNKSRPEYPDYLARMGLDSKTPSEMELLARSDGRRTTDWLCVYPEVEPDERGEVALYFFSHGVCHLDGAERAAIARLKPGEPLGLIPEKDNPHDPHALVLETAESVLVGYCPRYLAEGLGRVLEKTLIHVQVERANPDAPPVFLLLCKATFVLPEGLDLYATEKHRLLAGERGER